MTRGRGIRVDPAARILVLYDADCGVCTRTSRVLQRLDRRSTLSFIAAQAADGVEHAPSLATRMASLHVRDVDGRWLRGGAAAVRIGEAVPLLGPISILAHAPVLRHLVEPAYELLAANRHRISRRLGMAACPVPPVRR